jgi:hypothetical protein
MFVSKNGLERVPSSSTIFPINQQVPIQKGRNYSLGTVVAKSCHDNGSTEALGGDNCKLKKPFEEKNAIKDASIL